MSDFLGRTLGGTLTCREGKLKVGDNSARAEQEINHGKLPTLWERLELYMAAG